MFIKSAFVGLKKKEFYVIKMHGTTIKIYDVFYSQYSQQHVSAGITAIYRVMLLLQEYRTYKYG